MYRRAGRRIGQPASSPRWPFVMAAALAVALAGTAWLQAGLGEAVDRHPVPAPPVGALIQLPGVRGCVSERSREGCGRARGLAGAAGVAIAGRYVYVASARSSGVAIFTRDPVTGALRQLSGTAGCVSESGKDGCATGRGLSFAFSVAISPNGRSLYVAGADDVAAFARNPKTGALSQLPGTEGCIAEYAGDGCAVGRGLLGAASVAVSPDGRDVYVASSADQVVGYGRSAVVALARAPGTGALTELPGLSGCTNEDGSEGCQPGNALALAISVVVAPDGRHVYVGSEVSSAVVSFERESDGSLRQIPYAGECTSQGGRERCATGRALGDVAGVAISPDGGYLYAGAARSSAVATFFLSPTTGGIDQLKGPYACTAEGGTQGCATGRGLVGAGPLALSPDGQTLYVAGDNSLAAFGRERSSGRIDQLPGGYACVYERVTADGCTPARGLATASSVALSPNGRFVYVTSLKITPNQSLRNYGTVAVFARVSGPIALRVRFAGLPHRCVARPFSVSVSEHGTLPIRSLKLTLDGRVVAHRYLDQLTHRVDAQRLHRGSHTLTASATDLAGDTRQASARFRRC